MRSLSFLVTVAAMSLSTSGIAGAASLCPAEVSEAKPLLTAKAATAVKAPGSSRSQAGVRGQDVQAPRSQDVLAPRNVTKGRGAALANARALGNEAEVACKDAEGQRAVADARVLMEPFTYLP